MTSSDKNSVNEESAIGVALSAFLGTVALFFAGLLITQINSYSNTIRLPIVYLVLCTVSLIFSAIIYANISGSVRSEQWKLVERHNQYANIISEFCGVVLFLLSVPMVINAVTTDALIRIAVSIIVLASLFLYSTSSFSILSRLYPKGKRYVTSSLLTLCGTALLYVQTTSPDHFIEFGLGGLGLYIIWITSLLRKNTVD